VKVIPSNQTLILSGERSPSGDPRIGALPYTLRNAGSETVLKRFTLVASRPDATLLYVQADYSPTTETTQRAEPSMDTALAGTAVATARTSGALERVSPEASRGNAYRSSRGVELYASTQRMHSEARLPQIDVHA
jgi:hypothetical protein